MGVSSGSERNVTASRGPRRWTFVRGSLSSRAKMLGSMRASGELCIAILFAAVACTSGTPARPAAAPSVGQPSPPTEIVVRAQTEDEAFSFLWRQLQQMPFYCAHGYDVALPDHPLFHHLADQASPQEADQAEARRLFAADIYRPGDFDAGKTIFEHARAQTAPALATFDGWTRAWGFEHRARIDVVLTLYGPGGSYDPDASTITVLVTAAGGLRKKTLDNVLHEMLHLGIERPI